MGATLSLGIGSPVSVLHFIEPGGWPAYTAEGSNAKATGVLTFLICGELTEIPAHFGMPFDIAKKGFFEYFDNSQRPQGFNWVND
jgi:hypothetical protein